MYVKRFPIVSFTEESRIWLNKNAYDCSSIVDQKSLNGYFGKLYICRICAVDGVTSTSWCAFFRDAVEHTLFNGMCFILHPLPNSCMCLGLLASTSKPLLVHLYLLGSQLFQVVHFLDKLLHCLLEAIS